MGQPWPVQSGSVRQWRHGNMPLSPTLPPELFLPSWWLCFVSCGSTHQAHHRCHGSATKAPLVVNGALSGPSSRPQGKGHAPSSAHDIWGRISHDFCSNFSNFISTLHQTLWGVAPLDMTFCATRRQSTPGVRHLVLNGIFRHATRWGSPGFAGDARPGDARPAGQGRAEQGWAGQPGETGKCKGQGSNAALKNFHVSILAESSASMAGCHRHPMCY